MPIGFMARSIGSSPPTSMRTGAPSSVKRKVCVNSQLANAQTRMHKARAHTKARTHKKKAHACRSIHGHMQDVAVQFCPLGRYMPDTRICLFF